MSMKLTPCPMAKSKSAHTSSGVLWMKPSQPSATALTRRPVAVRFARRYFASDTTASVREGVPLWDAYLTSVSDSGCCRYENATSSKPRSCSSLQRLTR